MPLNAAQQLGVQLAHLGTGAERPLVERRQLDSIGLHQSGGLANLIAVLAVQTNNLGEPRPRTADHHAVATANAFVGAIRVRAIAEIRIACVAELIVHACLRTQAAVATREFCVARHAFGELQLAADAATVVI